jgi:pimeloyl-ACP methyl ester carboxylesterase
MGQFGVHARRFSTAAGRKGVRAATRRVAPPALVHAVPAGRIIDLPGRGRTYLTDVPGPSKSAPTVVLLHALGTTAALSWCAAFEPLAEHYRVITFDQRWHGRGIRSSRFRFADCADDVVAVLDALDIDRAVIVGYSMGGAIAQLVWQRHPDRVAGLVLCSTARNFRGKTREQVFFAVLTGAMYPLSRYALKRVEQLAAALPDVPAPDIDVDSWGRVEFRSTSAWSMPEVLGEIGRFNSAPWLGEIDVPVAVVVTAKDKAVPVRRQRILAASIDGAEAFTAPGGHGSIVLDATNWTPILDDALSSVRDRLEPVADPIGTE